MIQLITPPSYGEFSGTLVEMHRLRYRVFKLRMGWDVQTSGDMEVDAFDALTPIYLVQRSHSGEVQGSVRLLPSIARPCFETPFPRCLNFNQRLQPLRFGKVVDSQSMLLPTLPKEITASPARPMNCLQEWSNSGFPGNSPISSLLPTSEWNESFGEPAGPCDALVVLSRSATLQLWQVTLLFQTRFSRTCAGLAVSRCRRSGRQ